MISRQIRDWTNELASGMLYQPTYNEVFDDISKQIDFETVSNIIDQTTDQFFLAMNGENVKFTSNPSNRVILQLKYDHI